MIPPIKPLSEDDFCIDYSCDQEYVTTDRLREVVDDLFTHTQKHKQLSETTSGKDTWDSAYNTGYYTACTLLLNKIQTNFAPLIKKEEPNDNTEHRSNTY